MTNNISNREIINLLLPYLSGNEGGEVNKFTTLDGFTGYRFPCPFCGMFYDNPKTRNKKMASLFPVRETGKYSDNFMFLCKRKKSNECRGGLMTFRNFYAMYMGLNPHLQCSKC